MKDLQEKLEQARAARLKTLNAIHKTPTDQSAIAADNDASAYVQELELELSRQTNVTMKPSLDIPPPEIE